MTNKQLAGMAVYAAVLAAGALAITDPNVHLWTGTNTFDASVYVGKAGATRRLYIVDSGGGSCSFYNAGSAAVVTDCGIVDSSYGAFNSLSIAGGAATIDASGNMGAASFTTSGTTQTAKAVFGAGSTAFGANNVTNGLYQFYPSSTVNFQGTVQVNGTGGVTGNTCSHWTQGICDTP